MNINSRQFIFSILEDWIFKDNKVVCIGLKNLGYFKCLKGLICLNFKNTCQRVEISCSNFYRLLLEFYKTHSSELISISQEIKFSSASGYLASSPWSTSQSSFIMAPNLPSASCSPEDTSSIVIELVLNKDTKSIIALSNKHSFNSKVV